METSEEVAPDAEKRTLKCTLPGIPWPGVVSINSTCDNARAAICAPSPSGFRKCRSKMSIASFVTGPASLSPASILSRADITSAGIAEEPEDVEAVFILYAAILPDPFADLVHFRNQKGSRSGDGHLETARVDAVQRLDLHHRLVYERRFQALCFSCDPLPVDPESRSARAGSTERLRHEEIGHDLDFLVADFLFYDPPSDLVLVGNEVSARHRVG